MSTAVCLRTVKEGELYTIEHITAAGELGRRIRDMGLVPGADIEIVGKAPLFDPVALRLTGFTISLRNSEADYIFVTPKS